MTFAWFTWPKKSLSDISCVQSLCPATNLRSAVPATSRESSSVIINEIAWGGTKASPTDEWIELYNTTEVTVSLDGWQLVATDGNPILPLTGTIAPHAYFLIERTDDDTVSDIPANLILAFGNGLENTGETLQLVDHQGLVVDSVNNDGGAWPNDGEGGAPDYRSLERQAPDAPDIDDSWVSNDGTVTTGRDALGQPIAGTPGSINAAFLPRWTQHADLTVVKSGPETVLPGALITYEIRLRNRGGMTATDVIVTDTLPAGTSYLNQTPDWPFRRAGNSGIWQISALPPDGVSILTLTARVTVAVEPGEWLINHITATAATPELNSADNEGAWETRVQTPTADLSLSKIGPETLLSSDPFTYVLTVSNLGPSYAYSPLLTDALPSQVRLLSYTTSVPISPIEEALVWSLPSLAPGASVSLVLTTQLTTPLTRVHTLTNLATVSSWTPDTITPNNIAKIVSRVGEPKLLISGVLYDGYQTYDRDEAIELVNIGSAPATLDGWTICKDISGEQRCYSLPGLSVAPGERVWLARDAGAFTASFGHAPHGVVTPWPGLTNTGDEVLLREPNGLIVDTLVYGAGELNVPGWEGPPLTYYYNYLRGEAGQILSRIPDEKLGLPLSDTDTLGDWIQTPDNPILGRRVRYPGWDEATLFHPLSITTGARITVGIAPDNAFEVVSTTLMSARRTISAELYTFTHPDLIRLLTQKASEGIAVTLLLTGNPVGIGADSVEWHTELYACQALEAEGGACWFMVNEPDDHRYPRYTHLHAKMIIVDGTWLLVSTQNMTPSGLPASRGLHKTSGSRGSVIITDAPLLTQRAITIFSLDLDPEHHNDLVRWNTEYVDVYGMPDPNLVDLEPPDGVTYTIRFTEPLVTEGNFGFELLTAPEAALRQSDALLGLLQHTGPGDEICVEQMYEQVSWGDEPDQAPNLRLESYIDAARRGARVRVLLNGHPFAAGASTHTDNAQTVAYINDIAHRESLDLHAALGDPTGDGIHNKMVLVKFSDGGNYVHLGSINGSEASSKVNREVALQTSSRDVYSYLQAAFEMDWSLANPVYLPLTLQHYTPPPEPADYPLISEVLYDTSSPELEWVEIHNPTTTPVDLSDWKLGDAETADAYEPMFQFPEGTQLPAGAYLVIAVNANAVPQADLEFYDSRVDVPNMIPYPAWGDPSYPFALRNAGDTVLLLNQTDTLVDGVVWGDGVLQHIVPHPGVAVRGASLERIDPARDTDNCALDFTQRYPPTPGSEIGYQVWGTWHRTQTATAH